MWPSPMRKTLVQNVSSNPIVTLRVDAAVGKADGTGSTISQGDGPTSTLGVPGWERLQKLIPPNGRAVAPEGALRSITLAYLARHLESDCLHTAAFVAAVDFADGTSWQQSWPQTEQMWKKSLPSGLAALCPQPPVQGMALRQLAGSGFLESVGQEALMNTSNQEAYAFICSVRRIQGKLMTVCPF